MNIKILILLTFTKKLIVARFSRQKKKKIGNYLCMIYSEVKLR